jgi:methionyl-tRNA formyltransferase
MSSNLLFCAYRTWAIDVYEYIKQQYSKKFNFHLVRNQASLESSITEGFRPDYIICIGWSWIIPSDITEKFKVVGIHPSDLPNYAGGSPLQHQISEGIVNTKNSLFRLNNELDSGPILAKVNLSLTGSIDDIFKNLTKTSIELISLLIEDKIEFLSEPGQQVINRRKRLTEKDGELTIEKLQEMSVLELYNFLRCRMHPYPNAYLEDKTGKLYFSEIIFQPKKEAK